MPRSSPRTSPLFLIPRPPRQRKPGPNSRRIGPAVARCHLPLCAFAVCRETTKNEGIKTPRQGPKRHDTKQKDASTQKDTAKGHVGLLQPNVGRVRPLAPEGSVLGRSGGWAFPAMRLSGRPHIYMAFVPIMHDRPSLCRIRVGPA